MAPLRTIPLLPGAGSPESPGRVPGLAHSACNYTLYQAARGSASAVLRGLLLGRPALPGRRYRDYTLYRAAPHTGCAAGISWIILYTRPRPTRARHCWPYRDYTLYRVRRRGAPPRDQQSRGCQYTAPIGETDQQYSHRQDHKLRAPTL